MFLVLQLFYYRLGTLPVRSPMSQVYSGNYTVRERERVGGERERGRERESERARVSERERESE